MICEPFSNYDDKWFYQTNYLESYHKTTLSVVKMLIILFSCYLFGNSFLPQHDNYVVLLVRDLPSRIKYFITKVLSIIIILVIVTLIIYMFYLLVGKVLVVNFKWTLYDLGNYSELFFQSLGYGTFAILMILVFKNSLGYMVPYLIYVVIEIVTSDQNHYPNYLPSFIYISCAIIFTLWSLTQYSKKNL